MKLLRRLCKRTWFRIIGAGAFALFLFVEIDYWTYPLLTSSPSQKFAKETDGIWLRYTWYFGEIADAEMQKGAAELQEIGIRYAFFHVRAASGDGGLDFDYMDRAAKLNDIVKDAAPNLKRIAWIYVGNKDGMGTVDLSRPETRVKLVESANRLIKEGGFEGIQWDYEICEDGDRNFLKLLEQSRNELPPGTFLGVCTPTNYSWPLVGFGWSEDYFREVAERCDQMALMIYDTGMVLPRMYASHVQRQVGMINRATKGNACRVLFGLPSYDRGFRSHNPRAENLKIGIRSLRSALERGMSENFEGISIFADYTMDADEWAEYSNHWKQ